MSTSSLNRLYVGNLAITVDEYTLIQLCSKFGKISRMDYLFHKAGPSKGKPRGYAFVEYSTKEEALRAIAGLHEKLIRGRKIVVTAASEQTSYPEDTRGNYSNNGGKQQRGGRTQEVRRPTAISLLKGQGSAGSTDSKIAALEAKLSALRKGKEGVPVSSSTDDSNTTASTSTLTAPSIAAGLPQKPWFQSAPPEPRS